MIIGPMHVRMQCEEVFHVETLETNAILCTYKWG